MTHSQGRNYPGQTNTDTTQRLEFADRNFKAAVTYLSKDLKEKVSISSAQIGNASGGTGNATKNQIPERKSTTHEMNTSLDRLLITSQRRRKKG